MNALFSELQLGALKLRNRIGIPAMCQYSAQNGLANDWHFVHYASRAVGGAGLIIVEATAVCPEGRISAADLGLWHDEQIEPLARIAHFASEHGCAPALQLAHAGRKASSNKGWESRTKLSAEQGAWTTYAPSALAFSADFALPHALDAQGIQAVITQFAQAARRALSAGFAALEIHAAHGYLLHQFLSPLSNHRQDAYGGSFANRTRLVREVVAAIRQEWPERSPLFLRLSATDWAPGGWNIEESIQLCQEIKLMGVNLIDVSSGGLTPAEQIPIGLGYQTHFAARVRHEAAIPSAAVGLITSPAQAEHIIRTEQADIVLLGREILRDPYWPLHAAQALGGANFDNKSPLQYRRAMPSTENLNAIYP